MRLHTLSLSKRERMRPGAVPPAIPEATGKSSLIHSRAGGTTRPKTANLTAEGDPGWAIFDRRGHTVRTLSVRQGNLNIDV
jgi:hypothetical protein